MERVFCLLPVRIDRSPGSSMATAPTWRASGSASRARSRPPPPPMGGDHHLNPLYVPFLQEEGRQQARRACRRPPRPRQPPSPPQGEVDVNAFSPSPPSRSAHSTLSSINPPRIARIFQIFSERRCVAVRLACAGPGKCPHPVKRHSGSPPATAILASPQLPSKTDILANSSNSHKSLNAGDTSGRHSAAPSPVQASP